MKIFKQKLKEYIVFFSEGNGKNVKSYKVNALNKDNAYTVARDILEKECIVNGSPYFFIQIFKY